MITTGLDQETAGVSCHSARLYIQYYSGPVAEYRLIGLVFGSNRGSNSVLID